MPDPALDAVRDTLLRASTLLYLFRALTVADSPDKKRPVELHIVRLANEVSGTDGGFVVLPSPGTSMMDAVRQRDFPPLTCAAERAAAEGIVYCDGITASPLYVRGRIEGVIAVMGPDCCEVLGALVSLASTALESALEFEELLTENTLLKSQVAVESGIVGESASIRQLRNLIGRVAPQDATVLILGESGTGKELIARAIHDGSPRAHRPFVAINCAALTESLLESELFGHERGAFTGAVTLKKGKLEMAEGGSVFLDEIGELAPKLQAKLLRVLQERTFERVGGTHTIPLDIRLIAATNRDLAAEAKQANFRSDLYHRLNVISLKSPPLRERGGDILLLARHFLDVSAARCRRSLAGIAPEAETCLLRYQWPGNVRELQNAIEHGVILGTSEWILPEDLPESVIEGIGPADLSSAYHSAIGETRRDCIVRAWREAGGDHNGAAVKLGLHPNSLRRLIRILGLRETLKA
ncbi:MAG: sigma-54 dependent transcriptional regulator [Acidobacteriota bacterium]|nr:sigma-54 dependent transcriptional regulator [Acidobacteriota bacterium]